MFFSTGAAVQPFLQGKYTVLFSYSDTPSGEARLAQFIQHYGTRVQDTWATIELAFLSPIAAT